MRSVLTPNYTFTPGVAGAGKLDLSGIPSFDVRRLIMVVDATTQVVLYAIGIPSNGYTARAGGVLTLAADTSGCAASDQLTIFYDDGNSLPALESGRLPVALSNTAPLCVAISPNEAADEYEQLAPSLLGQSFDPSTGVRQQVDVSGLNDPAALNAGVKQADCKGPIYSGAATNASGVGSGATANSVGVHMIVDTQGYGAAVVELFGTFAATVGWFTSNDMATGSWQPAFGFGASATTGYGVTAPGAGIYIVPCVGRYLKIQTTAFVSGFPLSVLYLRNGLQLARPLVDAAGRQQIAVLGADGVSRGIGGLPPGANSQGVPSLAVQDVSQAEGMSLLEIALQMLRELQINNFYISQLARQLNTGLVVDDDVSALRSEPSLQ